jgi:hypothetical protein
MNCDEGSPQGVIAGDRKDELDNSLRMLGGMICLNDMYFIQITTRGVASIACLLRLGDNAFSFCSGCCYI